MFHIPEIYFKNAEEVIEWHKSKVPGSFERYLKIKEKIKTSGLPGFVKLLNHLKNDKDVKNFSSYLAELNLANLLLDKKAKNLAYEPKDIPVVDFAFDDMVISVKSLHPKNYEKNEFSTIEQIKAEGGGMKVLSHKNFSEISLKVEKNAAGNFGFERIETGVSGLLDSDIDEMSAPLKYIRELEDVDAGELRKVLFFLIQSSEFSSYYITDITEWYFDIGGHKAPIFGNNMLWYEKLFGREIRNSSVDGLVFMYSPMSILSWPPGSLSERTGENARIVISARDEKFCERLKELFS